MTWGQLRMQLQTAAPGLPLDLLDEFLNGRYKRVLAATDWSGIDASSIIQTVAAHQSTTDTVTLTVGSASVTVVGTTFTNAITGRKFYRPGDTVTYTVTWVDATHFTLDRPYEGNGVNAAGTVYAGAGYVLMQNVYQLPSDCGSVVELIDPVTGIPLVRFTPAEMDASAGMRTLVEDPTSYAIVDDTAETSPPVLHQVELFPPPLYARGIPIHYRRGPLVFDGTTTTASPLPFVSDQVLLAGCRADIATHLEKFDQARAYSAEFLAELNAMLKVEHQQVRKKPVMRMAERFTRHRMQRAMRGFGNIWGPGAGGPN